VTNPTTIQVRRATAASASVSNPVLAAGELGFETDTGKFKIGDGSTAWNSLSYATDMSKLPDSVRGVAAAFVGNQVPTAAAPPTAAGEALVSTGAGSATVAFTPTKAINLIDAAQPLGAANPGTGDSGAAASDHVHPMPTSSQLADSEGSLADGQAWVWNATAGKMQPAAWAPGGITSIWESASNGEITLPRGHVDDSGSFGQTPATNVLHLSYFVALSSRKIRHIKFATGATAASGNELTQLGLYSVDGSSGALALVASSAAPGSALGTWDQTSLGLAAECGLTAGQTYAVGILQIGATSASLLGAWANNEYLGQTPVLCQTLPGQSSLPSSVTSGLCATGFAVFFFLTS
jgi:hypothetical protein